MKSNNKLETGKSGEELAVAYLKKQGYRIIERNYKTHFGEIDIIAREGRYLCFIEVKTRINVNLGYPEEAVTRVKQRKISQNALSFLEQLDVEEDNLRFDVVSVILEGEDRAAKINLIRNAFPLFERYF